MAAMLKATKKEDPMLRTQLSKQVIFGLTLPCEITWFWLTMKLLFEEEFTYGLSLTNLRCNVMAIENRLVKEIIREKAKRLSLKRPCPKEINWLKPWLPLLIPVGESSLLG